MKRITQKSLSKLTLEQIKTILIEKEKEKKYLLELDKTIKKGDRRLGKNAGRLNTLDNQIYLIKSEVNNRTI
jgi:hypothetical protein